MVKKFWRLAATSTIVGIIIEIVSAAVSTKCLISALNAPF
jgi:hypothetical protein